MNSGSRRKIIFLFLLLLAFPWFFELLHLVVPPNNLSLASFITPSFDEYLASSIVIIGFLLLTYYAAIFSVRIKIPFKSNGTLRASRGIIAKCAGLLPLLTVLDLVFLFSSLQGELAEVLLAFRNNEVSIGYFGYFLLYYYPIVLAITWFRNKASTNISCLVLFAITNLITGFRTILISSLILIVVYNYSIFKQASLLAKFASVALFIALFLAYGAFRTSLELGALISPETGGSFLDSLNRSFPIRYMVISLRSDVSATFSNLLDLFASPFSVLIERADGTYNPEHATAITERLVRPYLVWRGTPGYLASGFSIHIVPFSYLFFGVFGLFFSAFLIGSSFGLGINLSSFHGVLPRVIGSFLITFALSCSESFISGFGSLCYRTVFLLPLIFFSAVSSRSQLR